MTDLRAWVQSLPKTETHLHLEGSLPLELARTLDPIYFAETPRYWAPDFRYTDFAPFQAEFDNHFFKWFVSPENYYESCKRVFATLVEQNCVYLECSFHLGNVERVKAPFREIAQAIHAAKPPELEMRLFLGMFRDHNTEPFYSTVQEAITWDEVAGVDHHGFENPEFQPWSRDLWARTRALGKVTKAHAGEFSSAEDVRQAVVDLGVTRIQHGLRAMDDPAILNLLRERDVTCDMTPISNLKLQAVPSLSVHPIRKFMEAGIRCTISTDDPMLFGNNLNDEYVALGTEGGLTRAELIQIAKNGFEVADISDTARKSYLDRLNKSL